jgi:hypothetical protein
VPELEQPLPPRCAAALLQGGGRSRSPLLRLLMDKFLLPCPLLH